MNALQSQSLNLRFSALRVLKKMLPSVAEGLILILENAYERIFALETSIEEIIKRMNDNEGIKLV